MKSLLCILFTFGLWLALTWSLDAREALVGVMMAILVATLLAHIYPENLHKVFNPRRWFFLLLYIPYFLFLCVKSNLDVAYRVLHPDMPIRPGIVKVRTTLRSEMAKTFLANSITLTPGTMSVDIEGQDLYIHWINVRGEDPEAHTASIVRPFEGLLRRIFE
ncbi:MAG TPA: Na+/H+ antiporter subunit E [Phycisphaerae bacterium]|jgi:multicomponent Na+:H+ antiporter subunit E|nr:Na+/H+ antiporter subunit E [Phycisphaerae bacterium]